MNRFLNYFACFLTVIGAIFTLLQSVYLVVLRLSLFPFTPQFLNPRALAITHTNVVFIQDMIIFLLIISTVEISLLWLLVVLNLTSQRQGLIATLVLVIIVGAVSLFAFSSVVF